jgi:hypothetical protein
LPKVFGPNKACEKRGLLNRVSPVITYVK